MIHQMSTTTTVNDEYVLNCTCGIQFIGSKDGAIRNMVYHQEEAVAARAAEKRLDGCTCGGIGDTGAHSQGCPWSMK